MSPAKKSLLSYFEDNELKISVLYKIYSQKIPSQKEFWQTLSEQEVGHANELSGQKKLFSSDSFAKNKFALGVIQYVNDFVEKSIANAKNKTLTPIEAINTALRIEQSILEKKCFDVFIPSEMSLKEVLKKLNRETDQHIKLLRKELKKQK